MPRLQYHNIAPLMEGRVHGTHPKSLIVLHETVSPDAVGWSDIDGVAQYLADKDYGMHGLTDKEGHIAWALGCGSAVFWHAGGVNEQSIGIEQVSRVMLQAPTNKVRRAIWVARNDQLHATAKLVAAACRSHKIPLAYSNSLRPGITSHWDVSQHHARSLGHTDCWPVHKGGYYPILTVIKMASVYYKAGYTL